MRLRNRIAMLAMGCLLAAPCAVRADVLYKLRLTSTPAQAGPTFFGGVTSVQTAFSGDVDLGSGFDLTGASGNLILQLLAPVGKQIEMVADATFWRSVLIVSAAVLSSGQSSLAISVTPSFVDLSAGTPAITSSGTFSATDLNPPGNLSNLQVGTFDGAYGSSVVQIAAGTRLSGISFSIPIAQLQANFPGFDLMYGLPSFSGFDPHLVFYSEVPGDQTATMTVAARFVDAADVPEPGTGLLMLAVLGLSGIVRANRRP